MEPQLSIFDALSNTPQEASSNPERPHKAASMAGTLNRPKTFVERACTVVQKVHGGERILARQRTTCEGTACGHITPTPGSIDQLHGAPRSSAPLASTWAGSKRNHANPSQVWEVVA